MSNVGFRDAASGSRTAGKGSALRSKYSRLLNGRFPGLGAQNRSGNFPPHPGHSRLYVYPQVTGDGEKRRPPDGGTALCMGRSWENRIPYFATAAMVASRTDFVLTFPERAARELASAHRLVSFRPPIEIEGFGYRMLWHPRTQNDAGSTWLRQQVIAISKAGDRS